MTIFYSMLFSLPYTDPKKNLYTYLPFLQYRALQATGTLKEGDTYALICDSDSALFLRRAPLLSGLKILVAPKPETLLEGMALKFILHALMEVKDQVCVYMDLDILPIRQIDCSNVPENKLLLLPEGPASSNNYCGDTPLSLPFGVSAGFFIWRDSPLVRDFFKAILKRIANCKKNFYALDQPHFNHLLTEEPFKEIGSFLKPGLVSFNGNNHMDTAALVNCCGDPGDASLHFSKVLQFFLGTFIRAAK